MATIEERKQEVAKMLCYGGATRDRIAVLCGVDLATVNEVERKIQAELAQKAASQARVHPPF